MSTEPKSEIETAVEQLLRKSVDYTTPDGANNAITAFVRGVSTVAAFVNSNCDPDDSPEKLQYNIQHAGTIFDAISDTVWLCDENSLKNTPEQLDELFVRLDKLLYKKMLSLDIIKTLSNPDVDPVATAFLNQVVFVVRRAYVQAYLRIAFAPFARLISDELWDSILSEFYDHVQVSSASKVGEITVRLTQMFPQAKGDRR
jgi:hypothetical protein